MDLTVANAFLFLLTLVLVSLIGWLVLKNTATSADDDSAGRAAAERKRGEGKESLDSLLKTVETEISHDTETEREAKHEKDSSWDKLSHYEQPPTRSPAVSTEDINDHDEYESTPVDTNQPTATAAADTRSSEGKSEHLSTISRDDEVTMNETETSDDVRESTPQLSTLSSLDEMESEIKEAANERVDFDSPDVGNSEVAASTEQQGEDWIVL